MGVTISYRGSLGDFDRMEDFEDRVVDLALELGGQARVWRSTADHPRRMVRGVLLNLFPGQETTSLLVSPEGWLINPVEIEASEKAQLAGPPWCFVKTQFGPIEGHVALVELFTVLKREFFADLEVQDEGGYWETRDLAGLTAKIKHVQAAMDGLAEGLRRYGLSPEAAEDQEILLARIERIARLVRDTLSRPSEHPPVHWGDDETDLGEDADSDESRWDALYKENRRRQERMHRAVEDHLAQGDDLDDAFDAAMHEETSLGLPQEPQGEFQDDWSEDDDADEPWTESLPEAVCREDDDAETADRPPHPLQEQAFDLMLRLHGLLKDGTNAAGSHQDVLLHAAGEIVGGLAQALGGRPQFSPHETEPLSREASDWQPMSGLSVVQLKRALRGAAFALGALLPLKASGALDQAAFQELHAALHRLQNGIYAELSRLRQRREGEF